MCTPFVSVRVSSKKAKCSHKGQKVTCKIATLAKNKSFKAKIVVRAISGKTYLNRASVTSSDLDRSPGNNKSVTRTKVLPRSGVLGVQRRGGTLPRTTG